MVLSVISPKGVVAQSEERVSDSYEGNGFQVEFTVVNQWEGEYEGKLVLRNTGSLSIENWRLGFTLDGEITSVWNGTLLSHEQDQYQIKHAGWNQDIKAGKEVSFGFLVKGEPDVLPENYCVQSTKCIVKSERYKVKYTVADAWEGGYNVSMEIVNTSEEVIEDWEITFPFDGQIRTVWNGQWIDGQAGFCTVKNAEYNQNIYPGGSVSFGFTCDGEVAEEPSGDQIRLTEYIAGEEGGQTPDVTARPTPNITTGSTPDATTGLMPTVTAEQTPDITAGQTPAVAEEAEKTPDVTTKPTAAAASGSAATTGPVPTTEAGSGDTTEPEDDLNNLEQYVYLEYAPGNMAESVVDDIRLVNDLPEPWEVTWQSSDPSVVSDTGQVCRDLEDHDIVLTAVIQNGDQKYQIEHPVKVVAARNYHPEEIEDLCVEDLDEMNEGDEGYYCKINDYGYIDAIYGQYSTVRVDSYESALYSLLSVKTALGLTDPLMELVPYRAEANSGGQTYRFTQMIDGVECFDNTIIVGCDSDGMADFLVSTYFPVEGAAITTPSFGYEQCREELLREFPGAKIMDPENPRMFMINYYGYRDPAWEMSLSLQEPSGEYESGSYQVLMGAQDCRRKFMQKQEGFFMGASYRGKDMEGQERTIRVVKEKDDYLLKNPDYHFQLSRGDFIREAQSLRDTKCIRRQKEYEAEAEEISAMYSLEYIHKVYDLKFSRKGYDGKKSKLDVVLAGDRFPDEAGWFPGDKTKKEAPYLAVGMGTGGGLSYIDTDSGKKKYSKTIIGKEVSYAASSDTLCHEFTHGVINASVGHNRSQPAYGSEATVYEAYADIGASIVNGANEGSRWKIAENLYEGNHAMRDLADPHKCYGPKQVFGKWYIDVDKFRKKQREQIDETHQNSTVISHAFYRMYELAEEKNQEWQAGGKDSRLETGVFDHIWYNTIPRLHRDISFYQVRLLFWRECGAYCKSIHSKKTNEYRRIIGQAFEEAYVTFYVETHLLGGKKGTDELYYTEEYFNHEITFQGKVVAANEDSDGRQQNLEGVRVTVCDQEGTPLGNPVVTGERGRFELPSELADNYVFTFEKEGYLSEKLYLDKVNEKLQTVFNCPLVEMIPENGNGTGGISGTIKNAVTLKGIEGLKLSLRRGINCRQGSPDAKGTTGENGRYQWKGLAAGCYCMEISGKGFETAYLDVRAVGGRVLSGQDGFISKDLKKGQVRVVLTWGETPRDLDAHMMCRLSCGEEYEVDFMEMEFRFKGKKICALDVDDLTSYGPETVTIYNKKAGKYTYAVHRFSDGRLGDSDACVQVYLGSGNQSSYTFYVPRCGEERYWTVFRYNAATNHVNPINRVGNKIMQNALEVIR